MWPRMGRCSALRRPSASSSPAHLPASRSSSCSAQLPSRMSSRPSLSPTSECRSPIVHQVSWSLSGRCHFSSAWDAPVAHLLSSTQLGAPAFGQWPGFYQLPSCCRLGRFLVALGYRWAPSAPCTRVHSTCRWIDVAGHECLPRHAGHCRGIEWM